METNNENRENRNSDRNDFDNTSDNDPNEIPEEGESKKEGSGYHSQSEVDQPQRGANTSYSEQTDVTPPNKKEFPSVGPSKTDFESRPHGRTTGRMLGHEPGTEGM